jgi:hypothetical protein
MLEVFENYLKKVDKKEKVIIYLIPIMLICSLIYFIVLPIQEERLEFLDTEIDNIHNIIKLKSPKNLKNKIKKTDEKIALFKAKYSEKKDELLYLYSYLTNLESLEFDARKWTKALDEMLKKSIKLGIDITLIKNSDAGKVKKLQKSIVAKKFVQLQGKAYYSQLLKYIAFLEDSNFLIDIKNIYITKSNNKDPKINFVLNFTIYGVQI